MKKYSWEGTEDFRAGYPQFTQIHKERKKQQKRKKSCYYKKNYLKNKILKNNLKNHSDYFWLLFGDCLHRGGSEKTLAHLHAIKSGGKSFSHEQKRFMDEADFSSKRRSCAGTHFYLLLGSAGGGVQKFGIVNGLQRIGQ